MDNEAQLVEKSRAGDENSFAELIGRHRDALFNLAWHMTGNWHEAADITQEAFLRAFRSLGSFKPGYSFRNWLLSIGANAAKNLFRSRTRRRQLEQKAAILPASDPVSDPGGRREWLDLALTRLEAPLRAALVLKHVEGMSYDEVARTLGIGISAAKMRVARGREELVRLVERERRDAQGQ